MSDIRANAGRAERVTVLPLGRQATVTTLRERRRARLAHPSTGTDQRGVDELAEVLTGISALIARTQTLRARNDDPQLTCRLDWAITQLETVGHELLTHDTVHPGHKLATSGSAGPTPADPAGSGHEEAFLTWLTFCPHPDQDDPDQDADGSTTPDPGFDRFLAELQTSSRVLPREAASKLGLPTGSTIGQAATALRRAIHEPSEPHGPPHAAVFHLHDRPPPDPQRTDTHSSDRR
jgi:hypothetical protein